MLLSLSQKDEEKRLQEERRRAADERQRLERERKDREVKEAELRDKKAKERASQIDEQKSVCADKRLFEGNEMKMIYSLVPNLYDYLCFCGTVTKQFWFPFSSTIWTKKSMEVNGA